MPNLSITLLLLSLVLLLSIHSVCSLKTASSVIPTSGTITVTQTHVSTSNIASLLTEAEGAHLMGWLLLMGILLALVL